MIIKAPPGEKAGKGLLPLWSGLGVVGVASRVLVAPYTTKLLIQLRKKNTNAEWKEMLLPFQLRAERDNDMTSKIGQKWYG